MQLADNGRIKETFPDDIMNYLACKVFPIDINYQTKKRLMCEARKYFLDDPYLFKVCGDNLVRQ